MRPNASEHKPSGREDSNIFSIQKEPEDYLSPNYLKPERMSSYGYQYRLAMHTQCDKFLNIGSANRLLTYLLEKQGKIIIDLDINLDLNPNICAGLPFLPIETNSIEVVMSFQVLEHMPFDQLPIHLKELERVSSKYIIISLPDSTVSRRERYKFLFYRYFSHPREWKIYRQRIIDKEHFWEIGLGSVSLSNLVSIINNGNLQILKHFRNHLHSYHHFFVLEKNN